MWIRRGDGVDGQAARRLMWHNALGWVPAAIGLLGRLTSTSRAGQRGVVGRWHGTVMNMSLQSSTPSASPGMSTVVNVSSAPNSGDPAGDGDGRADKSMAAGELGAVRQFPRAHEARRFTAQTP